MRYIETAYPLWVPKRMKNSRSKAFWLAKHKHTIVPIIMEPFALPVAWFCQPSMHTPPLGASEEGVG